MSRVPCSRQDPTGNSTDWLPQVSKIMSANHQVNSISGKGYWPSFFVGCTRSFSNGRYEGQTVWSVKKVCGCRIQVAAERGEKRRRRKNRYLPADWTRDAENFVAEQYAYFCSIIPGFRVCFCLKITFKVWSKSIDFQPNTLNYPDMLTLAFLERKHQAHPCSSFPSFIPFHCHYSLLYGVHKHKLQSLILYKKVLWDITKRL